MVPSREHEPDRLEQPPVLPKLIHQDCRLSERPGFHNIAATGTVLCARSGEKTRWLNPAPCIAAKGMYLAGARKQQCQAERSSGRCRCEPEAGTAVNMRGRLYGLVERLIYASTPLASEPGGRTMPRRPRGLPMWVFLAINPRAGRNSRRYPRKLHARGAGKNPHSAAIW